MSAAPKPPPRPVRSSAGSAPVPTGQSEIAPTSDASSSPPPPKPARRLPAPETSTSSVSASASPKASAAKPAKPLSSTNHAASASVPHGSPHVSTKSASARISTRFGDCEVLFHGPLAKRTREGSFERYVFLLTTSTVSYNRLPATAVKAEDIANIQSHEKDLKSIALVDIIVRPLRDSDCPGAEKRSRTFCFLSKQKSFLLQAKTAELSLEWFEAINNAARDARKAAGLPELNEEDTAPLWVLDETSCQICHIDFSFFVRKHHCRNCGRCVCDPCAREKVRIPKFDERTLFKVCSDCAKILKERRKYGASSAVEDVQA